LRARSSVACDSALAWRWPIFEVFEGMSPSDADARAYDELGREEQGDAGAIAGRVGLRLMVASAPPWPNKIFEAAAALEIVDHYHRTGMACKAGSRTPDSTAAVGISAPE